MRPARRSADKGATVTEFPPKTTKGTFRSVQALRAVAAILVIMQHYIPVIAIAARLGEGSPTIIGSIGHFNIFGASGVPIFFVISGFVMGLQPDRRGWSGMASFAWNRIARIVPLYWIVTLAAAFFVTPAPLLQIVKSLLFVAHSKGSEPVVGPGWTLEYEMMFYTAFTLIVCSGVLKTMNRGLIGCAAFLVLSVALNMVGIDFFWKIGDPIVLEFCAGMLISRIFVVKDVTAMWPLFLFMAGVIFTLSLVQMNQSFFLIDAFWGVGATCLVLGLVCAEHSGYVLGKSKVMQLLGRASYAIYLCHVPLILGLGPYYFWGQRLNTKFAPDVTLVIITAIAIVFGVLVHLTIEWPITIGLRRLTVWKRARRDAGPIATGLTAQQQS